MVVNSSLDTRREEILAIVKRHGGRNVRVFGSQARGEGAPDSDLDILIDLEPGRSLLDIVAIKQDLEDLLGCSVDVVTEASVSPYIREHVLSEAIAL
jgi:predicted nucleotidyltransferase